jgi:hypothetical protein
MKSAIGVFAVLLVLLLVAPVFHQDLSYGQGGANSFFESMTPDHVVSHAPPEMKLFWFLWGGAVAGIGLWWAQLPKERARRSRIARFIGVVLYWLGSSLGGYWLPFFVIREADLERYTNHQPEYSSGLFLLALSAGLLLASYFLCFRTRGSVRAGN